MPKLDVAEQQILESLAQLSPAARREALRRLLLHATYLDRAIERNQPRMEQLARDRGRDWNALSEDERERFIDEVVHEQDSMCA